MKVGDNSFKLFTKMKFMTCIMAELRTSIESHAVSLIKNFLTYFLGARLLKLRKVAK